MLLPHVLLKLVLPTIRLSKALLASKNGAEVQSSKVVPRFDMAISIGLACEGLRAS
jgi:hypothetical protein